VVPVTLLGTGTLMPNGKEGTIYSKGGPGEGLWGGPGARGGAPPIVSDNAEELCAKSREAIAQTLRENGMGVVDVP